ncbi:MAG: hypothetical protein GY847_38630 [Proteobacteria bacterium]|nr:hypothetical protein [Pseudomonadota bacterium]
MWAHKVKVKHLFSEKEDHESIQNEMNAIADILDNDTWFIHFSTDGFRSIPEGDSVFEPVDYANRLLSRMYDFADAYRIWIE